MPSAADRPIFVYMTAGNAEEARALGRALVEEGLAACVNLIDGMRSIYRWDGRLAEDDETVMIAKSTAGRLDNLTARVRELHSYDCPCVVGLEIAGGNPAYLDWIGAAVG